MKTFHLFRTDFFFKTHHWLAVEYVHDDLALLEFHYNRTIYHIECPLLDGCRLLWTNLHSTLCNTVESRVNYVMLINYCLSQITS